MRRSTPMTSVKQISEINLTPLMDLTFILLITFIITFPLLEQGIPVDLPDGKATALTDEMARTITIDAEGRLYFDDVATDLATLGARLPSLAAAEPTLSVMIRADEAVRYGVVAGVLRLLHEAHITRLSLVTEADG